ncbi:MAG: hypothetical protein K2P81_09195 [Bacteriovoracaceae bacterium]|nr:hypothetical protein [Bacteriovoracaceae bacterium]
MKSLIILSLLFTHLALAKDVKCVVETQADIEISKEFDLIGIEEQFPEIPNFDGGNMAIEEKPLVFSNECDNWMEIIFADGEFDKLKLGLIQEISGKVEYSNSGMDSSTPGAVPSPYNVDEFMLILPVSCKAI